jgi:hypothetical protein
MSGAVIEPRTPSTPRTSAEYRNTGWPCKNIDTDRELGMACLDGLLAANELVRELVYP